MSTGKVTYLEGLRRFAQSPLILLGFALAGVLCGFFAPQLTESTNIIGEVYLTALGLIAVPFLFSALSTSLAAMLQSRQTGDAIVSLPKMALLMFVCLVLTSLLFYGIGKVYTKAFSNTINVQRLDEMLKRDTIGLDKVVIQYFRPEHKKDPLREKSTLQFSFGKFLQESVPTNIFQSLVANNVLHILILTICFGIALGLMPSQSTQSTISVLNVIYHACMEFVNWSTYLMPLCIFSLISKTIVMLDGEALTMVSKFLIMYLCIAIVLSVFSLWIWSRLARISLGQLLQDEGRALLFAFCSGQRLAVLPMLLRDMKGKQLFSERGLNLVMPFSFTVGRFTRAALYMSMTVLMAHLYGVTIPFSMVVLLCFLTPLMTVGGVYPLSLAVLLKMLNLPDELAVLLLASIVPLERPFAGILNVSACCAFSAWCLRKEKRPNVFPRNLEQMEAVGSAQ